MRDKIGIIGHFALKENFCDGQTVKTKNLADLLELYEYSKLVKVDTHLFKKGMLAKVKLLFDTFICFFKCKHVFLLVSVNGMNFYLPFIFYFNKLFKSHVYHYVIGSELLQMVEENEALVKYLNALDVNWFEYKSGTDFLRNKGVRNAETLPNFKLLTPVASAGEYKPENGVHSYCTFSRVMKEKGITEAIEAIRGANLKHGKVVARLDVYGPLDPAYESEFDQLLIENKGFVAYKGVADSSGSVDILKNYYALLFPTHWPGEGFPGTIIDAFAAGVPIIASDWNANRELVKPYKTGLLYPSEEFTGLEDVVNWSIQNYEAMTLMRIASRAEYNCYTPDKVLLQISDRLKQL